jgi:hypothetical protein
MFSTTHANQCNWLPAGPIVNQNLSYWQGPPANISSGFGPPPYQLGVNELNELPSAGFTGAFIQDSKMPLMINTSEPEPKYGVSFSFSFNFIYGLREKLVLIADQPGWNTLCREDGSSASSLWIFRGIREGNISRKPCRPLNYHRRRHSC